MKIFDCTTYYNEDLMLDIRFNILSKYVHKFVISEARYSHSGKKKELNFDINKFPKFKNKIIYKIVEDEPNNIIYQKKNNIIFENQSDQRTNSVKRINYQRDSLLSCLNDADEEDYILYSDNDEIPKLENLNLEKNNNKILIFKQKLFYYKLNLFFDRIDWYGTKLCKKKHLRSMSWLRDIKSKKYPKYRFDTFFSKTKYIDVKIIDDGGWHFSQLKTPKDIQIKLLNGEQYSEFIQAGKDLDYISDLVKRKMIDYDHKADSKDNKYMSEFKLKTVSIDHMPKYLQENKKKYSDWFDADD